MTDFIAIDWANKEENISVFDGTKVTKKMPSVTPPGVMVTENMREKIMKPYLDAGWAIFRCSTHQTEKYRQQLGWEKNHDNDVKIIWGLYKHKPQEFYRYNYDPIFMEFKACYATFKELQRSRVASGNRFWSCPDNATLAETKAGLMALEKQILSQLKKSLQQIPIYTEFLKDIPGIDVAIAAALIAYIGDINRFQCVSCFLAYFGLHVVDGKSPRRAKGQLANWHQDGKAMLLGVLASIWVKGKAGTYVIKVGKNAGKTFTKVGSEWRTFYDKRKEIEVERADQSIKGWKAIADKRAKRYVVKVFMKKLYKAYKGLANKKETAA